MKKYAALFCRGDSAYKLRDCWDVYDIDRDAKTFAGGMPGVCHPPCRTWGVLAHMAYNARAGEKDLALWSIDQVRANGGIIEHPQGSKLFRSHLPDDGMFPDAYGGFTVKFDQYDFGHVAHKDTKIYVCGIDQTDMPPMPPQRTEPTDRSICGNVFGTKRCTQYQREYTPEMLIDYFESVLTLISNTKLDDGVPMSD